MHSTMGLPKSMLFIVWACNCLFNMFLFVFIVEVDMELIGEKLLQRWVVYYTEWWGITHTGEREYGSIRV